MALNVAHRGWDSTRQGYRASPSYQMAIQSAHREWVRLHENPPAIAPGSTIAPGVKVLRATWKEGAYEYKLSCGAANQKYDLAAVLRVRAERYTLQVAPISAPPSAACAAQFWLPPGPAHHIAELMEGEPTEEARRKQAHEKFILFMAQLEREIPLTEKERAVTLRMDAERPQKPQKRGKVKNSRKSRSGTGKGKKPRQAPKFQSGGLRIRKVAA